MPRELVQALVMETVASISAFGSVKDRRLPPPGSNPRKRRDVEASFMAVFPPPAPLTPTLS